MGIFDLAAPIFSGLDWTNRNVVDPIFSQGKQIKGNRAAFEYIKEELEDLKGKKEALDEAMIGPETGIRPAGELGEGRVLVDNEGVLIMAERAARVERDPRMIESIWAEFNEARPEHHGIGPSLGFSAQDEAIFRAYEAEQGYGGGVINFWGIVPDLKRDHPDYRSVKSTYENLETRTGKKEIYARVEDLNLWKNKKITFEQLRARSYENIGAYNQVKRSIIEERKRTLDPVLSVPLF